MDISRRQFVQTATLSAAALGASRPCAFGNTRVPGANDLIRVGVAGFSDRFQVVFSSRMTNSAGDTKEVYYSNGGTLNLDTNEITPDGGLTEGHAKAMNMKPNLLEARKLRGPKAVAAASTGSDPLTSAHMRNWLECVRARKRPNAPIEAGYNHAIAVIMANAAYRTGEKVTFDEKNQDVMAGGKVFKY